MKRVPVLTNSLIFQVTVLLGCTLSGHMLPPQIIYQGKTDKCHPKFTFPEGWDITHTENHWSNETTMLRYADKVIAPYLESVRDVMPLSRANTPALCVFDVFRAHCVEKFQNALRNCNVQMRYIPAGCTGELQPLDLSGNAEFKHTVRGKFQQWYANKVSTGLESGQSIDQLDIDLKLSTLKPVHAGWIVSAFEKVDPDTVIRGWIKSGIKESVK